MDTAPTATLVPAGWYPDPEHPLPKQRHWDGAAWTGEGSPDAPPPVHRPLTVPKTPRDIRPLGVLIGLAVLAVVFVVAAINNAGEPAHSPEFYAQGACEQAATYDLKAPSTAEFPADAIVSNTGGEHYDVLEYVDSQNGFGAQIRSSVHCTVTRLAETKQWRVDSVSVS